MPHTHAPLAKTPAGLITRIAPWIVLFSFVAVAIVYWRTITNPIPNDYSDLFKSNFHVFLGLPLAALGSFFLVTVLEHIQGPIELKGPGGIEFKGAAGPILLWIFCFLSFVYAFDRLWVKPQSTANAVAQIEKPTSPVGVSAAGRKDSTKAAQPIDNEPRRGTTRRATNDSWGNPH
jgi:hypothetical protein